MLVGKVSGRATAQYVILHIIFPFVEYTKLYTHVYIIL